MSTSKSISSSPISSSSSISNSSSSSSNSPIIAIASPFSCSCCPCSSPFCSCSCCICSSFPSSFCPSLTAAALLLLLLLLFNVLLCSILKSFSNCVVFPSSLSSCPFVPDSDDDDCACLAFAGTLARLSSVF